MVYHDQGLYQKALEMYEESLKIKTEHYKTRNNVSCANAINNIAIIYKNQGLYQKALEMLDESLKIKIKHYKTRDNISCSQTLEFIGDIF